MNYSAIPGWFQWEALYDNIVAKAPKKSVFVEVGCWYGRGLVYLAKLIQNANYLGKDFTLYGVDTRRQSQLIDNLTQCKVLETVTLLPMHSTSAAQFLSDQKLHFVFLDRTIAYSHTVSDIEIWRERIEPGGILAGSNFNLKRVKEAVNRVFPEVLGHGTYWTKHL